MASREETLAEIARLEAEAKACEEQAHSLLNGEVPPPKLKNRIAKPSTETHGVPDPSASRRCTAHSSRTGLPCKKYAVNGTNVCDTHGGKAPQVVAKARQRLQEAADRMARNLLGIADDESGTTPSYVQLQAINSALDRAGIAEPKDVTVTVKSYESLMADIELGSREAYRRGIGDERAGEPPAFGELESAANLGPGGSRDHVRVLGTTFDGHDVIDGELVEHPASVGQGEPDDGGPHDDAAEGQTDRTETLANYAPTLNLPNGGYMPTELAMEHAADANRAAKRNLRRL